MYGRRKLWLRHRGGRLCGLCTGEPVVGRPRGCLLEAGGPDRAREIRIPVAFTKLFQSGYDSNYRTTRQPQLSERQIHWPRARPLAVVIINRQACTRGHRIDYDGWAEL